jgi:hypothetical protein
MDWNRNKAQRRRGQDLDGTQEMKREVRPEEWRKVETLGYPHGKQAFKHTDA